MSLVGYEYSDDEEDSKENSNGEIISAELSTVVDLTTSKVDHPTSKPISVTNSLNNVAVKRNKAGKIQISVPTIDLVNQDDSDDSDDDTRARKYFKKSDKGSNLISMLPKPKNASKAKSASVKTTLTSLIPNSVSNRGKAKEASQKPSTSKIDESDSFKPSNFFFNSLNDDDDDDDDLNIKIPFVDSLGTEEQPHNTFDLQDKVFGPEKPVFNDEVESAQSTNEYVIDPNSDVTYKKFIASKFGEESADQINIVDIDVSKHLSQNQDWLKNITIEKPVQEEDIDQENPNSTARRKHQITFLAFQAKKREVDLKNQWAQNRLTKSQTKSKYGF